MCGPLAGGCRRLYALLEPWFAMPQHSNHFYPARDADAGLREDQQRFLESAEISLGLPSLFYASLRHPRIFETVTGRTLGSCRRERTTIRGFRLGVANAGTGFPGVFPADGPAAPELECLLVHDLNRFEQTMVAWYEWDEYVLRRIPLADGRAAQAFVPNLEAIRREYGQFEIEPWSFDTWRAAGLDRAVAHAREWMTQRPGDAALLQAGCVPSEECPAGERATG